MKIVKKGPFRVRLEKLATVTVRHFFHKTRRLKTPVKEVFPKEVAQWRKNLNTDILIELAFDALHEFNELLHAKAAKAGEAL